MPSTSGSLWPPIHVPLGFVWHTMAFSSTQPALPQRCPRPGDLQAAVTVAVPGRGAGQGALPTLGILVSPYSIVCSSLHVFARPDLPVATQPPPKLLLIQPLNVQLDFLKT